MEQHVTNAVAFAVLSQWTVPTDAFIPVGIERLHRRCVSSHDPDVHHISGLPVQARPDEACGNSDDRFIVDEAWSFIQNNAVIVAPCPLGADDVKFLPQLNDLSIELFQLCADFFLRRYDRSLLSR